MAHSGMVFALIHSPLCGPLTWSPVAEELRRRGIEAVVPMLHDDEGSAEPLWAQQAQSAAAALTAIPADRPLVLVGHSGGGSLLPIIRQMTPHPLAAYLFVDAGLPHGGTSRLDEMETNAPTFAAQFRQHLASGGRYPTWSDADLATLIPDDVLRSGMVAELQPRALPFWTETLPSLPDWPDVPCAYMQFTASYPASVERAEREGWPLRTFDAGHFHMLVDPVAVTDALLELRDAATAR
jgi:pimeloyl-ACP methyl ester carboxylesterase